MENSYKTRLEIQCSVERFFTAISQQLGDWWGKQDKGIEGVGTIFTVSWGEPWYQFKVIKFIQDQEMIWECIDANQKIKGLTGVEKEWVGTKVHWKLEGLSENQSRLIFQHEGLVPDFLCFNFCSSTWEHFLKDSLRNYLETEKSEA
ncbi:MAG: hypothetical protein R8P61_37475 [Bacteroidia bacterium]|nr:hypothetical protein [Bacteroidia bacterium]